MNLQNQPENICMRISSNHATLNENISQINIDLAYMMVLSQRNKEQFEQGAQVLPYYNELA